MSSLERTRVYGELGTVYARCGGIFGISSFTDRCMDMWMADERLNANQAVATWHAKAQRCGFKFLVVQIMGQLTGGPQRYTGRPMDEAHKHLNIRGAEWEQFMEIFNGVCEEFQLPGELIGDLNALMISFEEDCVIEDGERAPPNPGPSVPRGNSVYARCGGVYPLALFVDRLVDALLQDERVGIPCDGQKRNEASLKYLFTEVVCGIAGGPEIITAKDFDETKLLLPKASWEIFIATAQLAADHLPVTVRAELVQCLQRSRALIVDPSSNGAVPQSGVTLQGSANVKSLQAAVAGKMLSSAAIAARHAAPGAHVGARRRVMGDPRTLYGRGGGVFGLAKLADNLMEAWMADPALNANPAVAKWHESQQKFGFKFLVTQLLGYLTGGPQRYTGAPMDAAHKHLGITVAQWTSFIADAVPVFQKLGVNDNTQSDLMAILSSFQEQCVVQHGQEVPADPGMCRARPTGNKAYAQLGGVYPIALFADRLVDKVLQGNTVQVQWNDQEHSGSVRHPPGLKYMFTELLCHSAGGPELPTSKGFDEAKLGIDPNDWEAFLGLVGETATIWPTKHHRDLILKICEKSKVEICLGMEGQDVPNAELLLPSSGDLGVAPAQSCPFSGQVGGQCPFKANGNASKANHSIVEPAKAPVSATSPNTSERDASGAVDAPMRGRILGNAMQQKLDTLLEEDPDVCCPVSLMVFRDPVIASDGFIYERTSLAQLHQNRLASPMTREVLKKEYRMATDKKAEVVVFRKTRSEELLVFAAEAMQEHQALTLSALERVTEYIEAGVLDDVTSRNLAAKVLRFYGQLHHAAPAGLRPFV